MRLAFFSVLGLLVTFGLPASADAKIGFRQLTTTFPVAVQRGQASEVQVRSNFTLDETYGVYFERSGMTMTFLEKKPIAAPRKGRGSKGTPFRFRVEVPEKQTTGPYEFRIATQQAVSSCGQLLVTDFPVVTEDKGNNGSLDAAQDVPVPAAICGVCERFEDLDFYCFEGVAGQPLTLQVFAQRVTDRIHSMVVKGPRIYLMDPILTLYGPNGQVVAQNDNFYGGDSLIACTLPTSGKYKLEVRDARFAGDPRYTYCVEISDKPFAFQAFPMAVQRGQTATLELIGHGLGKPQPLSISVADDEPRGWSLRSFQTARGETNPTPLKISPHPQIREAGSNDSFKTAQALQKMPVGVNGRLEQPQDTDFYSFTAKKGQRFQFETEARRYGSPVDTVLEVYDARGKLLAEQDDLTSYKTKDSRLLWKAPADGTYAIAVRDLHDRGGERFCYHLTATVGTPDFDLFGEYYYAMLAPGVNMIWFARAERRNGFTGPIRIEVEGLPPGVTAVPTRIPAGMNHCAILLRAAADAPIGAGLVRVKGVAEVANGKEKKTLTRYGQVTCEQQSSGGGQSRWPIQTQLVGVTKPLDLLEFRTSVKEVTLTPGKPVELPVTIKRAPGFKDAVSLDMTFLYFKNKLGEQLPPGVTMSPKSKARLVGKQLEGKIVLVASKNVVEVEKLPIAPIARVSITFSITTNYATNPVLLTVKKK